MYVDITPYSRVGFSAYGDYGGHHACAMFLEACDEREVLASRVTAQSRDYPFSVRVCVMWCAQCTDNVTRMCKI